MDEFNGIENDDVAAVDKLTQEKQALIEERNKLLEELSVLRDGSEEDVVRQATLSYFEKKLAEYNDRIENKKDKSIEPHRDIVKRAYDRLTDSDKPANIETIIQDIIVGLTNLNSGKLKQANEELEKLNETIARLKGEVKQLQRDHSTLNFVGLRQEVENLSNEKKEIERNLPASLYRRLYMSAYYTNLVYAKPIIDEVKHKASITDEDYYTKIQNAILDLPNVGQIVEENSLDAEKVDKYIKSLSVLKEKMSATNFAEKELEAKPKLEKLEKDVQFLSEFIEKIENDPEKYAKELNERLQSQKRQIDEQGKNIQDQNNTIRNQKETIKTLKGVKTAKDIYNSLYNEVVLSELKKIYPNCFKNGNDHAGLVKAMAKAYKLDKKAEKKNETPSYASASVMIGTMTFLTNAYLRFVKDKVDSRTLNDFYKMVKVENIKDEDERNKAIVEAIIGEDQDNCIQIKRNVKTALKFVAIVAAIAVVGLGCWVGANIGTINSKDQELTNKEETIKGQESTITIKDIQNKYDSLITAGQTDRTHIEQDYQNSKIVNSMVSSNGTTTIKTNSSVVNNQNETDSAKNLASYYTAVETAYNNANVILSLNEDGSYSTDSKYQIAVDNYTNAINNNNAKDAEKYGEEISGYQTSLAEYKVDSNTNFTNMLNAAGLSLQDLMGYIEEIQTPTLSMEFSEQELQRYKGALTKDGNGSVKSILYANYEKATGNVVIVSQCMDAKAKDYINLITYTIDSNLTSISSSVLMKPFDSSDADKLKIQKVAFDNFTVDENSNVVAYGVDYKYNNDTDKTTVTATSLTLYKDGGVSTKSASATYQGQYTKDNFPEERLQQLLEQVSIDISLKDEQGNFVITDLDMENE
jgi:hypothetical protein